MLRAWQIFCCKLSTNQYQNQQVSFCPINMRNKIIIEYGVICVSLRLFRSYTNLTKILYTVRAPYIKFIYDHGPRGSPEYQYRMPVQNSSIKF